MFARDGFWNIGIMIALKLFQFALACIENLEKFEVAMGAWFGALQVWFRM